MAKEINKFITPGKERVVKSSAVNPVNSGLKLLVNVCSQNGEYDQPFDKELTKKWPKAKETYRQAYVSNTNFKLGSAIESTVSSDIWIVNLVVKNKEGVVDDKGLELGVKNLARLAKAEQASLHFASELFVEVPKLKELVLAEAVANGTNLYVYTKE